MATEPGSGGTTVEAPAVTASPPRFRSRPQPPAAPSASTRSSARSPAAAWASSTKALDNVLDRRVALKMLMTRLHADAKVAGVEEERFLREARVTAQLPHHPHVVGIYEAGVLDGSRYIAMEFIDGVPMLEWWKDKSIRLRQQVAVLRDAILGVHHAHEHGVIHRDLKPENILIDAAGQPHITDFGLARDAAEPEGRADGEGHGRRLAPLHEPRAGARHPRGPPHRRVLARRHPLRDVHGPAALRGRVPRGSHASRPSSSWRPRPLRSCAPR